MLAVEAAMGLEIINRHEYVYCITCHHADAGRVCMQIILILSCSSLISYLKIPI